ncbi:Universal stress protein family protein [Desulfuromusa kysingii]|uniref:Universal stress protein n=1 Tax=Desulfuromusa kysingii TaxID=37625 RepID=A0A1H4BGD9_9BACT|nr:universal stress protein [Desulfuromusa kysingii]SEA46872.1 Universal stress protein family protein [Desulfuromusa kysingii]
MKDITTVLTAIDFSDSSDNAFQMALSLAKSFSAKLLVVHVINEPVDLRGFYVPHISFEKLEEEIEEGAHKMMESFCRKNLAEFKNYECHIVAGLPFEQIIQQADEKSADLIVIGTHGRTGFDHVLFGSTAEKVVRKSKVPVLTVRLEEEE